MKYLIVLSLFALSACAELPVALQTCTAVVNDAAAANNVLVTTTTAAVTNGALTAAQASKVAQYSADANAIILTAQALCAAGETASAKTVVAPVATSVKIMKSCTTLKGTAVDQCLASSPKPKTS
jgi:hypothetical protein